MSSSHSTAVVWIIFPFKPLVIVNVGNPNLANIRAVRYYSDFFFFSHHWWNLYTTCQQCYTLGWQINHSGLVTVKICKFPFQSLSTHLSTERQTSFPGRFSKSENQRIMWQMRCWASHINLKLPSVTPENSHLIDQMSPEVGSLYTNVSLLTFLIILRHVFSAECNRFLVVSNIQQTWTPYSRWVNVRKKFTSATNRMKNLLLNYNSFQASWREHRHLCEEWAKEVPEGSKSRLPRLLWEAEWRWGGMGWWGGRAEEEQQWGTPEDHTTLPEEDEAGEAGWLSAEQ